MQVTQHDIARKAKVSRSLVSMALNNTGRVDAKTSQRILSVARKLGYRPNLLGKSMRTGQSMTVGVLIRGMDAYFGKMLAGVQETLQKNGYVPITLSVGGEFNLLDQVKRLLEQRVDGIILKPESQLYEKSIEDILRFNIPLVTVDNFIAGAEGVDFSGVNDNQLGLLAAQHFLKLGHRKLSVVTLKDDLHLASRVSCFQKEIEKNNGCVEVFEAVDDNDYSWVECVANNSSTGVFLMNDVMAAQFIHNAREKGFSMPQDFSVMGIGNIELSRFCMPSLSTFDQHSYNIGSNAVKLLLERMSGSLPLTVNSRHILETPTLIQRESTSKI
jgi:DNA-binding LacI/PurR family transcriptional regulator